MRDDLFCLIRVSEVALALAVAGEIEAERTDAAKFEGSRQSRQMEAVLVARQAMAQHYNILRALVCCEMPVTARI